MQKKSLKKEFANKIVQKIFDKINFDKILTLPTNQKLKIQKIDNFRGFIILFSF